AALLGSLARADVLLLKGGQRFEGEVVDKGKALEIKVGDNTLSIAKSEVLRQVPSIAALTAEAEKLHADARELYQQAIKPDVEVKAGNELLRKGVELLHKATDLYQEAREVYPEEKQTLLDSETVKLLQEMRLYRDKMGSEIAKSINPNPAPAEPKSDPAPEAKTAPPAGSPPKPPAPAKSAKPDLYQILSLAKAGDVEAMVAAGLILEVGEWRAAEATLWFRAAADKGHPRAQAHLGLLALEGRGRKPDAKEAQAWLAKADAKNEPLAKVYLARMWLEGIAGPRNLRRADDLCERAVVGLRKDALSGDPEVLTALGWMHLEGLGTVRSGEKALECFRGAAEQGDVRALMMLGAMYDQGRGVPPNRNEAVKAYRAAAEKGFAPAQVAYAEIHDTNYWRKSNPILNEKLAREWYLKASNQGHPGGQFWMGWFHILGTEGPKDSKEGFRLWTEAAKTAPLKLRAQILTDFGYCYIDAVGTAKDIKEAMRYSKEAAELGDPRAQNNMGSIYENDLHKENEAFHWIEMAARQNFAESTLDLGRYYREGKVVPKNLQEAERWTAVAVQLGVKGAADQLKEIQKERASGKR
ncbi:MAG TPA: hypothetical protein VG457_00545, partial [Planctomycetota bacterium]|nr:hypothetical protein [Planctomycetota bacterium]